MKLNLRSVDLNLLTVFDAIMETGRLSRAGEELGMSQPAVSAALQRLRETFGDDLFVRTREGMVPTPRARTLHHTTSQVLNQLRQELESDRRFDPAQSQRHFRVLGGDYVEMRFFPGLLARLLGSAPGISAEVVPLLPAGFTRDLLTGALDIAVHYAPVEESELHCEQVAEDRLVVVARAAHPRVSGAVTLEQFCSERHVILNTAVDEVGHFELFMGNDRVRRNIAARVGQFSSMVPAVLNTDCLCVMPEQLARLYTAHLALQCYPLPFAAPVLPIQLVWARRFQHDKAHQWFRQALAEVIRGELGERSTAAVAAVL
jgi:DNA-binding transcriptional LysR family regulator